MTSDRNVRSASHAARAAGTDPDPSIHPATAHAPQVGGPVTDDIRDAKDWVAILSQYREPSRWRSAWELCVTAVPFVALWALAWWSLDVSYALAAGFAVLNAAFLVRLFMIQHDCGHAAFFRSRVLSDWTGRAIGVLTLTPYDVWRRMHAAHHATTGNLERRGMGDVLTLTVDEFNSLSRFGRLKYRLYRHPLVMFGLGPFYLFFVQNRLPFGLMRSGARYWVSAMGTNVAVAALLVGIGYFGGVGALLLVFLPTMIVAASIGVWLFYVQHQFEETHWDHDEDWQLHDAALHGSSHYVLPGVLRWFSANIGVHHVHHLQSRVPFYRLPEILRDHPQLAQAQRLTLRESLSCVGKQLWDEKSRRLVSFSAARAA
ncbi:fatty acid desaturase [Lacimonas salitolerans]|uniref:Fatty acid desaturase n=1 Tax=Lacimonas salitolerans TaxID=1323750 RepID=A0ABW4EBD0_9RHOB